MTEEVKQAEAAPKKEAEAKKPEAKASDDVAHLSDEDIKWRSKYKNTKADLEDAAVKHESEKKTLSEKLSSTEEKRHMYEKKYIEAEVKAQAVAAGIRDIEFVELIKKDSIKLDENGNVQGVKEAIEELKTRKPDWFGAEKKASTSSNAPVPEGGTVQKVDARKLSKEDWQRNKSKYLMGDFSA